MRSSFYSNKLPLFLGFFLSGAVSAQDPEWALSNSDVGIGTGTPSAKLHVSDDFDAKILVENTGTAVGFNTKVMFNLVNDGGVRFDILDESTGSNWVFQNQFGSFDVTLAGTGTREFRFYPNGDLEISGMLIQSSSRDLKDHVVAIDHETILDKVMDLPISEWSYKTSPSSRHIGPMAQDFHGLFRLGETSTGISSIDTGGVALAAIQAVKLEKDRQIEEKNREIAELSLELDRQREKLAEIQLVLAKIVDEK